MKSFTIMRMLSKAPLIFAFLTILLLSACSDKQETPELRLRNWLTQMEAAVKAKDLSEIKSHISSDYQDVEGNTHQKIMLQLTLWFKRYDNIGLNNSVKELEVMGETARMVIDTKFSESQAFAQMGLTQNVYEFVLLFEASGNDWQLNSVSYQRKEN